MEQEIKNQLEFLNEEIAKETKLLREMLNRTDDAFSCANSIVSIGDKLRRLLVQFELLKRVQFSANQK